MANKEYDFSDFDTPNDSYDFSDFELPVEESKEEPSMVESLLRGGVQGVSKGFADEITGAGEALFTDKTYEQARNESRAAYKAAEEANPITYNVGDIGAGVASGLLTGGAGLVANLGSTGLKQGVKELAKLGAKEGAAFGLGQSEADLTKGDIAGAAKDTVIGAGAGATLGAALPILGKGLKNKSEALLDLLKGTKPGENLSDAFKLSQKGETFLGKKGKDKIIEDSNKTAEALLQSFKEQYKKGSSKIGKALDSDTRPKNVSENIKNIESMINDGTMPTDDKARLQDILNQYKQRLQLPDRAVKTGEVQGIDVKGIDKAKAAMDKSIAKAKSEAEVLGQDVNFTPSEVISEANILQSLQTTRNELGEQIPKVRQVDIPADEFQASQSLVDFTPGGIMEKYKDLNLQELQMFKKQMQSLSSSNKLDDYAKSQAAKASKEIDNLIKDKMSPSSKELYEQGNKSMSKVYDASEFMKEVGKDSFDDSKAAIDLADKMRKPNDKRNQYTDEVMGLLDEPQPELLEKITDIGTKSRLHKSGEAGNMLGIFSPNVISTYGGAGLGTVSRKLKTPVDITKKIINAPGEALEGFANRMMTHRDPSKKAVGETLMKALTSADKKDRLLWSLSRQPAFRQIIEEEGLDLFGVERDSEEQDDELSPIEELQQKQPININNTKEELLKRFRNR